MEDFGCSPSTLSHAFPRFKLPTKVPPFLLEGFAIVCGTRAPKGARCVPVRSLHDDDDDDDDDDESEASSAGRVYQNITVGGRRETSFCLNQRCPKFSKVVPFGCAPAITDERRASRRTQLFTGSRGRKRSLRRAFPLGTPPLAPSSGQAPDRRKVNRRVSKCWVRFPQIWGRGRVEKK